VGFDFGQYPVCDHCAGKWNNHHCFGGFAARSFLGEIFLGHLDCTRFIATVNSQGIRGSSASFGIITSISVRTHPIPSGGTFFFLFWDMDIPNASSTFSLWQSFALSSSLPTTFGGELAILKGSAYGRVQVAFLGSYFGSADQAEFNKTVEPFLSGLPEPDVSLGSTLVSGSWIKVLAAGAAPTGVLNTTMGGKDANDTFYAKSLMTPQDVPLTEEAMGALMEYLGTEGFESNTVSILFAQSALPEWSTIIHSSGTLK